MALLISNAIILFGNLDWLWLRLSAALALTFVLPGWAWLPILNWMQTDQAIERIVLIIGASSLLSALVLFITVLLPGPFTETPLLIALNLTTLAGIIYQVVVASKIAQSGGLHRENPKSKIEWPSRKVLLILLAILAVAAFTRLTRLGYAEFHEDALENMRLIVRAYKGEEYAPFLDSKGPIHWLLPAALWYLNGWLNEGIARTPFAVTSLALIPTIYVLGRRMSGRDSTGLLAAGFVSLNGFFVAYARHVENPSLIVFWGALAMWFAYRYYKEGINSFLLWTALALAIGLITHPDVLLYLPVFAYIIWLKVQFNRSVWQQQWPWLLGAGVLFSGLVGLFYIPYLTDPNIGAVGQYFADDRIGRSFLYNRVHNLFDQDQLYSTRFHAPVLVLLLAWLLGRNFARWRWRGWTILIVLGLAMIGAVAWPEYWIIGSLNFAFIPYALLTLIVISLSQIKAEIRILFLWMMAPLGGMLFLAKDAADHIQVAYTAWALLSAFAVTDLWNCLSDYASDNEVAPAKEKQQSLFRISLVSTILKSIVVLSLAFVISMILFYQSIAFLSTVTGYWQVKIEATDNPDSIYNWLYGSIPRPRKIFSNPRLTGWKVVGYLRETGELKGDFRSINDSFAVPIWYTFQTPRSCYTDPQNYWIRRGWTGWPDGEQDVIEQGYTLTRIVLVDQQPKLHLYEKNAPPGEPEIIDMEVYRHAFDRLATPGRFVETDITGQSASLNFGDKLLLQRYDLPQTAKAGELLPVSVYWESLAPMDIRYRAFVHLVAADDTRWGQHDDDPACRLLTTDMRPGQVSSREFRVPIDPATPPGEYRVVLGIYHPDTFERLDIWDNLVQQSPGNSLVLGHVKVE